MRFVTGLKFGLVAMLFYVAIRGSAAAWAPLGSSDLPVGWAAECGGRLLDIPGHLILNRWKGENWALQPGDERRPGNRDLAALFVVALPMAGCFGLGFLAGLIRGPGKRVDLDREMDDGELRVGRSLALLALALAFAGMAGYGFVTGFVAVVVALRARRHLPRHALGRAAAAWALLLGTLDAFAWIVILVTFWHPRSPADLFRG